MLFDKWCCCTGGGGLPIMCCCAGMTCCFGADCGYCSECVGNATDNTELCSSCIWSGGCVGFVNQGPMETPTPGSGTCIASNTSTSCTVDVSTCLPFAGTDENGNDIYQNPDGSLTYSDGSPASRADISCNEGACKGTICNPCSPRTCGTTTPPPHSSASGGSGSGGSGSGSAKPSAGTKPAAVPATSGCISKLSQAMNKFGSSITALLTGGQKTAAKNALPGQVVPATASLALTPNSYLMVILIVGGLLLFLAFGHRPTAD
jgi:hypothetical protein